MEFVGTLVLPPPQSQSASVYKLGGGKIKIYAVSRAPVAAKLDGRADVRMPYSAVGGEIASVRRTDRAQGRRKTAVRRREREGEEKLK